LYRRIAKCELGVRVLSRTWQSRISVRNGTIERGAHLRETIGGYMRTVEESNSVGEVKSSNKREAACIGR